MRVGERSLLISARVKTFAKVASSTVQNYDSRSQHSRLQLSRSEIVKVRAQAIRRRVWFRVLTRAERAFTELIIKVLNRVRSRFLAQVLTHVLQKLLNALDSKVVNIARRMGLRLARKLGRIAETWGNVSAIHWAKDPAFAQYLGVMQLNRKETFMV